MLAVIASAIRSSSATSDNGEQLLRLYILQRIASIPSDPKAAFDQAYQNAQQAFVLLNDFSTAPDFKNNMGLRAAALHQVQIVQDHLSFLVSFAERFPSTEDKSPVIEEQASGIAAMQQLLRSEAITGLFVVEDSASKSADRDELHVVESGQSGESQPTTPSSAPSQEDRRESRREERRRSMGSDRSSTGSGSEVREHLQRQVQRTRSVQELAFAKVDTTLDVNGIAAEIRRLFTEALSKAKKTRDSKVVTGVLSEIQTHLARTIQIQRGSSGEMLSIFPAQINEMLTHDRSFDLMQGLYFLNLNVESLLGGSVEVHDNLRLSPLEMKDKAFYNMARAMTFRTPNSFNAVFTDTEKTPSLISQLSSLAKEEALAESGNQPILVELAKACYQLQVAYDSSAMGSHRKDANFEALQAVRNFFNQSAVYDVVNEHLSEEERKIFFEVGFDKNEKVRNRRNADKQAAKYLQAKASELMIEVKPKERQSTSFLGSLVPEMLRSKETTTVSDVQEKEGASASASTGNDLTPSSRPASTGGLDLSQVLSAPQSQQTSTKTSTSGESSGSEPKEKLDKPGQEFEDAYQALKVAFQEASAAAKSGFLKSGTQPELVRVQRFMTLIEKVADFANKQQNLGNWEAVKGSKATDILKVRGGNAASAEAFISEQVFEMLKALNKSIAEDAQPVNGVAIPDNLVGTSGAKTTVT